jgi:hypothetical protein
MQSNHIEIVIIEDEEDILELIEYQSTIFPKKGSLLQAFSLLRM